MSIAANAIMMASLPLLPSRVPLVPGIWLVAVGRWSLVLLVQFLFQ